MLERVVFRESLGAWLGNGRKQICRLLSLRSAGFLRELTVDLLADEQALGPPAIQSRVEAFLAQLPVMPALERLCVGYHLSDEEPPAPTLIKDPRFPRLAEGPVFLWGRRGVFEPTDAGSLRRAPARIVAAGTRIGVEGTEVRLAKLGEPEARNSTCSFDEVGGRVMVSVTEGLEPRIRINGIAWGPSVFLLPGDLLEVFADSPGTPPLLRLRFGLESS